MQKCHSLAEQVIHFCNGKWYDSEDEYAAATHFSADESHTHSIGQKSIIKIQCDSIYGKTKYNQTKQCVV